MASFRAENVIYDDSSEDEVDNTREIQIEEALRLYQNALRLHSLGPSRLKETRDAYAELFKSEIFTYLRQADLDPLDDDSDSESGRINTESAPNSLPQILYLAYKNRGQFALDKLRYEDDDDVEETISSALDDFKEALSLDETDPDLWRRVARLGAAYGSNRLTKFCLESILGDADESDALDEVGIDGALAGQDLKELLKSIDDEVGLSHPQVASIKRRLNAKLARKFDPLPFLPIRQPEALSTDLEKIESTPHKLRLKKTTWTGLGQCILDLSKIKSDKITSYFHFELPKDLPEVETEEVVEIKEEGEREDSQTRKRKPSMAAEEMQDNPRGRSKRVKARDSVVALAEPGVAEQIEEARKKIEDFFYFDGLCYEHVDGLLAEFKLLQFGKLAALHKENTLEEHLVEESARPTLAAAIDLKAILTGWTDVKGSLLVHGPADEETLSGYTDVARASRKSNKPSFADRQGLRKALEQFNEEQLQEEDLTVRFLEIFLGANYIFHVWPESLKQVVQSLIIEHHALLYQRLGDKPDAAMLQTIFELVLDSISSGEEMKTTRLDMARRWQSLIENTMQQRRDAEGNLPQDELAVRYVWASVFCSSMNADVSREFTLKCLDELKLLVADFAIELPNSSVMPELSVDSADREIMRLKTVDMFREIFVADQRDPYDTIETLELILEPESVRIVDGEREIEALQEGSIAAEMSRFVASGSASLRILLWQKLSKAYGSVGYSPKTISCDFKCIEIIMHELTTSAYAASPDETRQHELAKWLHELSNILQHALPLCISEKESFNHMTPDQILAAMNHVNQALFILYSFVVYEDRVNVELQTAPNGSLFKRGSTRLRELYVRFWTMQKLLLREASSEWRLKLEFQRAAHSFLGARRWCKLSNRIFLKLAREELLDLPFEECEFELAQVLRDLYDLQFKPALATDSHECGEGSLDRQSALLLRPFLLYLFQKQPIKDIIRNELKFTIAKVNSIACEPHLPSKTSIFNQHVVKSYMSSAVTPNDFKKSLKGLLELSGKRQITDGMDRNWFFMMGYLHLMAWRIPKRVNRDEHEDLDTAKRYLLLALEYDINDWETWYCMAQANDHVIENEVVPTAATLNNKREKLAQFQREAIHCYMVATSLAEQQQVKNAKVAEMYAEFSVRVYSSSRPPFQGECFWMDNFQRFFSGNEGMYKAGAHAEVSAVDAATISASLMRRSLRVTKTWQNYYMLGKYLWKMKADWEPVVEAYKQSISLLPDRRDKQDPIFEPHFKLVCVAYKLVKRGTIEPEKGIEILQATTYAKKVVYNEGPAAWQNYILAVLKQMIAADKANWHHRFSDFAAHVISPDPQTVALATAAKNYFTQQIFTRTMAWQVWKPEYERPGRHYVYVSRYICFFAKLLERTDDKAGMELLSKKVRKKSLDLWRHENVWKQVCDYFVALLRRLGNIPAAHDEVVFKYLSFDDYAPCAQKLDTLCHLPSTQHPALDILRDAVELKKLNDNLCKPTLIDDLITDTYSVLYEAFMPKVREQIRGEEAASRNPMNLGNMVTQEETEDSGNSPPRPKSNKVGRRTLLQKADSIVFKPQPKPSSPTKAAAALPADLLITAEDEDSKEQYDWSTDVEELPDDGETIEE